MAEGIKQLRADIIDYNPKRMTAEEVAEFGIPEQLVGQFGDFRQYPYNIANHFPDGVSWIRSDDPWYFMETMVDEENIRRISMSDVLLLSGSGLSANAYEHRTISDEYVNPLERSQEVIRDHVGCGKWVLGICFGGQIGIHAVGGEIGRLPEGVTEAGWLIHELTPEGRIDDVFGQLPDVFGAPHFHNDFVIKLPELGSVVHTNNGDIVVSKATVLATRKGYLSKNGLENAENEYIMASVVEFDNGARVYQIQPHPEMATQEKADFLVRMNPWLGDENEMGTDYYSRALVVPEDVEFSVSRVITAFIQESREYYEEKNKVIFSRTGRQQIPSEYILK